MAMATLFRLVIALTAAISFVMPLVAAQPLVDGKRKAPVTMEHQETLRIIGLLTQRIY